MAAFSSLREAAICNFWRGTDMIAPASLELGLYTSDPQDDNSGTEVGVGIGYTRQAITLTAPASVVGTGTTVYNVANMIYGPATADWGAITHWGLFDNLGTFEAHGAFLNIRTVLNGEGYTILAGTLEILVR